MNVRLYDPLVGRFLSPDPYIQAPGFRENFNRYSYALNNPLLYFVCYKFQYGCAINDTEHINHLGGKIAEINIQKVI